jgi:hypothetical protein
MELPTDEGARTASTRSDQEGLFSLQGKHGRSLTVSFSKDGYYASQGGQKGFNYALGPDILLPDPRNPVVFKMRKKANGEPLSQSEFPPGMGQRAQLRGDGTPVEIDLPNGRSQLKLEFWRGQTAKGNSKFDWKCQLSISGGGIIETDQEFAFEAPLTGYRPSLMISVAATNQNWQDGFTGKYYIHLASGDYGRIDFRLLAYNGVFTVKSVINPASSRVLEPAN